MASDPGRVSGPLDAASFDSFYRDHRGEVFRYLLRDVGNRADAEEITQTAFLDAYRALRRGHAPELPRAWMFGIARNAARRRFRTQSRRPREVELASELEELLAAEPDDDLAAIRTAVAGLRPNYREAVFLREVEGLTYAEIGERMNLSQAAVETLLFRARRVLRDRLESEGIVPAVRRGLRRARGAILAPVGLWRGAGRLVDLLQADAVAKAVAGAAVVAMGAGIAAGTGALPGRAAPEVQRQKATAPAATPQRPAARVPVVAAQPTGRPDTDGTKDRRRDGDSKHHPSGASDTEGGSETTSGGSTSAGTSIASSDTAPADGSVGGSVGVTVQTPSVETPSVTVPSVTATVPVGEDGIDVTTPEVDVPSVTVPSVGVDVGVGGGSG